LKTMFVIVGTSNYIEDGAGRGGAFALLHNMAYAFSLSHSSREARRDAAVRKQMSRAVQRLPFWLKASPLNSRSPLRHVPAYQRWYSDWRFHSTYNKYWKQNGYNFEEFHKSYPSLPVCFVGGWYDIFKRGTLRGFTGLADKNQNTRLIMGPWTHSTGRTYAGNVDFGATAKRSILAEADTWFARHLQCDKKKPRPPRVEYFVMGGPTAKKSGKRLQSGGRWRTAISWPPANHNQTHFYFQPDGRLARVKGGKNGAKSRYLFDPKNPVPSIGGNIDSGQNHVRRGAQNQVPLSSNAFNVSKSLQPLSSRADVLSFQTKPLKESLEVAGPVRVDLWVSSTGRDTDFTAKLVDVFPPSKHYPQGYAMNLEDGILRMRFRSSREKETLMKPGAIYKVSIDLWSTANRFETGHRIRVDISSSSFPMYDINPNTGERLGRHSHIKSVHNTVYHDAEHPSSLVLPVR